MEFEHDEVIVRTWMQKHRSTIDTHGTLDTESKPECLVKVGSHRCQQQILEEVSEVLDRWILADARSEGIGNRSEAEHDSSPEETNQIQR